MRTCGIFLILFALVGLLQATAGVCGDERTTQMQVPGTSFVSADSSRANSVAGYTGLTFSMGFLGSGDNLVMETPEYPASGLGIQLSAGLSTFFSDNVAGSVEAAYMPITDGSGLWWGSTRTWSVLAVTGSLTGYIPANRKLRFYGRAGVKLAKLFGDEEPGEGLFGGTVGEDRSLKVHSAPGWEVGSGLMGFKPDKICWFVEVRMVKILTKDESVALNGETMPWKYPCDLTLYGMVFGVHLGL